jgi:hypothetical protein
MEVRPPSLQVRVAGGINAAFDVAEVVSCMTMQHKPCTGNHVQAAMTCNVMHCLGEG